MAVLDDGVDGNHPELSSNYVLISNCPQFPFTLYINTGVVNGKIQGLLKTIL